MAAMNTPPVCEYFSCASPAAVRVLASGGPKGKPGVAVLERRYCAEHGQRSAENLSAVGFLVLVETLPLVNA